MKKIILAWIVIVAPFFFTVGANAATLVSDAKAALEGLYRCYEKNGLDDSLRLNEYEYDNSAYYKKLSLINNTGLGMSLPLPNGHFKKDSINCQEIVIGEEGSGSNLFYGLNKMFSFQIPESTVWGLSYGTTAEFLIKMGYVKKEIEVEKDYISYCFNLPYSSNVIADTSPYVIVLDDAIYTHYACIDVSKDGHWIKEDAKWHTTDGPLNDTFDSVKFSVPDSEDGEYANLKLEVHYSVLGGCEWWPCDWGSTYERYLKEGSRQTIEGFAAYVYKDAVEAGAAAYSSMSVYYPGEPQYWQEPIPESYIITVYELLNPSTESAVFAMNNITSQVYQNYDTLKFTNGETVNLYMDYLKNYYGSGNTVLYCGDASIYERAYYDGKVNNGEYIKFSLKTTGNPEGQTCYASAPTKNKNKKVNGVNSSTMHFDGTKLSFDEMIAQMGELEVEGELPSEYLVKPSDGPGSNSSGSGEQDICYDNSGSLGWVLCPVLQKISDALDGVYTSVVEPFLVVNPDLVSTSSGTHSAWQVMVTIANILVAVFLSVVVFSQLTGIGIDNYGIKKTLPKIIAVAILVNLSYVICQLAVDLSNIAGNSLNNLLSNVDVNGLDSLTLDGGGVGLSVSSDNAVWFKTLFTVAGGGLVGVGIAALASSIVNGGWFTGLVLPILLLFVVALVAVLFFFILLGVRKAGVVLLVVIAPLAFVAYTLPNTKRWFDKWLKALEGLLILYPICGLLIGGGQLVSKILLTVSDDYMMYFTGCIVMVVPYFFIPTLLKGSFAAIGNIGAKISGLGRSLGARGRGRLDRSIRNSERFKNNQAEIARRNQERSANSTIQRLNNKRDRHGGRLNDRDTRRLARSQESLDRLQREDRAARTILSEREFGDSTMPELEEAWNSAFDSGDAGRLDALTNVLNTRYGSAGAKFIGDALAGKTIVGEDGQVNQNAVASLRTLQDNMNHNSGFATNMRNKASDAYSMISNAGMHYNSGTGRNEYRNLDHFSANNNISTDLKDWSTQSATTLQRAIDSGALKDDMVEKLLTSTDPTIQSGIQSDEKKRDVLQASVYNRKHKTNLEVKDAADKYREEMKEKAELEQAAESARQQESLRVQTEISRSLQNINGVLGGHGGNGSAATEGESFSVRGTPTETSGGSVPSWDDYDVTPEMRSELEAQGLAPGDPELGMHQKRH